MESEKRKKSKRERSCSPVPMESEKRKKSTRERSCSLVPMEIAEECMSSMFEAQLARERERNARDELEAAKRKRIFAKLSGSR